MINLPKFQIFGEGRTPDELALQPGLELRGWDNLDEREKGIIFRELETYLERASGEAQLIRSLRYLNVCYLHLLPAPKLHGFKSDPYLSERQRADAMYTIALADFKNIILGHREAIVLALLSAAAKSTIDAFSYDKASKEANEEAAKKYLESAFKKFDYFAIVLNHSLGQFRVNKLLTREGFIPRQDEKIDQTVYIPTLNALSSPRWKSVSTDLGIAFAKYANADYAETITLVHSTLQRFLQVILGEEEGRNGRGELKNLWAAAESKGLIPRSGLVRQLQGYFAQERATNSTAKPAVKDTSPEEALLMLNIAMVFIQFCLARSA